MKWLDSSPVKFLNFLASIVTLLGVVGGGIVGVHFGGEAVGSPVAASIGGFVGLVILTLFVFAVWRGIIAMMRTCPICQGSGLVTRGYARHLCPKCNGDARIF
jgi:hypothetical protein